jgi:choline kinase
MKTNILILAAGQSEFTTHDGGYPLCLTEVDGSPLLERVVANTRGIDNAHFVYALLDEYVERFHLGHVAQLITPNANVVRVPGNTQGSACTALLAAAGLEHSDAELLVISANELVDVDLAEVLGTFRHQELDGGTITFRSVHPRYSYVRLNSDGLVSEASQQIPISQTATAGIFWFRSTADFVAAAKNLIRKNAGVAGKFFIAPSFNELVLQQKRVGVYPIDNSRYHPMKSERQMQQFSRGGCE